MPAYTVERGDSWFSIAKKFGHGTDAGLAELLALNGRKLSANGHVVGGQTFGEMCLNPGAPPWGRQVQIPEGCKFRKGGAP